MAKYHLIANHDLLHPYELSLDKAAMLIKDCLSVTRQATEDVIYQALAEAVRSGAIPVKRGTARKYAWITPSPILDARDVWRWAEQAGLSLDTAWDWRAYCRHEERLEIALADRLRALRSTSQDLAGLDMAFFKAALAGQGPAELDPIQAQLLDQLTTCQAELERVLREQADELELEQEVSQALSNLHLPGDDDESEPDPRHRKTLLRIIGALAELAHLDGTMPAKRVATMINSQLDSMGQKKMKDDTIAQVIADARAVANELIE